MQPQSHVHTSVLARTTPVQHLGQCLHHSPCLHHATFRYASGGAASSDMGDAPINPEPSTDVADSAGSADPDVTGNRPFAPNRLPVSVSNAADRQR